MKNLVILALMMATTILHADGDGWKKGRDYQVSNLEKRTAMLTKLKSCLQSASSKEDVKACRKAIKTERESLKAERMKRKARAVYP